MVEERFLPFLHERFLHHFKKKINILDSLTFTHKEEPIYTYSEKRITAGVGFLVTSLAYLLPTLPIFALYYITSMAGRLGIIVGFTFCFSVTVTLVTKARRVECFAATAAFAAVLVVFVGGDDGSRCNGGCCPRLCGEQLCSALNGTGSM